MLIFALSFLAGILTILAPCVLPVLPVILWGTLNESNYKRIVTIIVSFVISIILFTFLLKVSTAFISIDQQVWKVISGIILILFGIISLFPELREQIKLLLKIKSISWPKESKSLRWQILLWASLWPIFTTCSPTYTLIIATILPLSLITGIISIVLYALGLWFAVGMVAVFGKTLIKKLHIVSDGDWWFKKILGMLIILTGLSIITGFDKKIETSIIDSGWFWVTSLEENLIKHINTENLWDTVNSADISKTSETTPPIQNIDSVDPIIKLLKDQWPAPEFTGLTNWLNGWNYTSISELKGKVVVVNFWTFECINCIKTLPYTQKLYELRNYMKNIHLTDWSWLGSIVQSFNLRES
jgi:cytochrome c biogenesis protein CcdA/thiol-disulfide isomerase/thioredoxin